jgi:cell division protein FtsB
MRARQMRQGIIIGVLILMAFWLTSLIWGLAGKVRVAIDEAHSVKTQYEQIEERKRNLEQNLAALQTARGQDAAIRTMFGVARPGEEVIVVVPLAPPTVTTTPLSWWQKILNWF